jgi:hypothetical protein
MKIRREEWRLPLPPVPDGVFENVIAFVLFWVTAIGLMLPAYLIGSPWGWFAYVASMLLLGLVMQLRHVSNTLVRTLPTLRLLVVEVQRLRKVQQRRGSDQ